MPMPALPLPSYFVFVLTNHDAVDVGGLVQGETESGQVGDQEHRDCADQDGRGGQAKLLLLHHLLGDLQ